MHVDALGTVTMLTDVSGRAIPERYEPFGARVEAGSPTACSPARPAASARVSRVMTTMTTSASSTWSAACTTRCSSAS